MGIVKSLLHHGFMCACLLPATVASASWSDFDVPGAVRERYAPLYNATVSTEPDGSKIFGDARLWRRGAVNVLYLKGDAFEMAFQHGKLLGPEIAQGSLERASRISSDAIHANLGDGPAAGALTAYAEHGITQKIVRYTHAYHREIQLLDEAWGLSEATGIPVRTILMAALGPESSQVLLGVTSSKDSVGISGSVNHCTDFAVWDKFSATGEMVIGRNTDYPLNGFYDRFTTVIYYDPKDGGQRYMTATSAGFHIAGVAGFNAAGLFVAVHTIPTIDVSPNGVPVFYIGQEVLRRAKTYDEALAIFRSMKPAAGWMYTLVSTKERRAASIEIANGGVVVVPSEGGGHVAANHWRSSVMGPRYLHINRSVDDDTLARYQRVHDLIGDGGIDYVGAMKVLADKFDPLAGIVRPFPNTVAVMTTVSSTVWLPEQERMFIGSGLAPTSQGTFVELPLPNSFEPRRFARHAFYEEVQNDDYAREYPGQAEAERLLIKAKQAFEYHQDAAAALRYLTQALAADSANPSLWLMHGMMAARAGKMDMALASLRRVTSQTLDQQRRAVGLFFSGRVLGHLGRLDEARENYDAIIADTRADQRLRGATLKARRELARPMARRLLEKEVAVMMQEGDAYRYGGMFGGD